MKEFLAGNGKAGNAIYERHGPWVFNFALRMLHDEEVARDACQESFLRAFTGLSSFRFECAFRTWLYRVAFNAILAERKRPGELYHEDIGSGRREPDDGRNWLVDEYPDEKTLPPELLLALEEVRLRCILAMLLCLDRRNRAAFVLRCSLGLVYRDIAFILNESEANVRQMVSRSSAKMSSFMAEICGCFNPNAVCQCRRTKEFAERLRGKAGISEAIRLAVKEENPKPLRAIAESAASSIDELRENIAMEEFSAHPLFPFVGMSSVGEKLRENPAFRRILAHD